MVSPDVDSLTLLTLYLDINILKIKKREKCVLETQITVKKHAERYNINTFTVVFLFYYYPFSVTKNYWVFYGVNTELFQSGSEFRNKVPIGLPWKFTIKFNIPERKFELEFPPCTKEIPLISLRYLDIKIYGIE